MRAVKLVRTLTLLAVLGVLLYVYADSRESVRVFQYEDYNLNITKQLFFYTGLALIVLSNFLIAIVRSIMEKIDITREVIVWFASLAILINIFLITAFTFINLMNSREQFNLDNFGYLTFVTVAIIFLWLSRMVLLLVKR